MMQQGRETADRDREPRQRAGTEGRDRGQRQRVQSEGRGEGDREQYVYIESERSEAVPLEAECASYPDDKPEQDLHTHTQNERD